MGVKPGTSGSHLETATSGGRLESGTSGGRHDTRAADLARRAFGVLAWLFVACLIVQFVLVGLDLFGVTGESRLHVDFAYTYGWLTPVLVLAAALAALPRRTQAGAIGLLVLFAIETYLPTLSEHAPWVAAGHPVLAVLVVWLSLRVAASAARLPDQDGTQAP